MAAADTSWSPAEAWTWERIRAGEIADFNARDGRHAADPLDPAKPEGWNDERRI